jgi:hypothetical protein
MAGGVERGPSDRRSTMRLQEVAADEDRASGRRGRRRHAIAGASVDWTAGPGVEEASCETTDATRVARPDP